jgi:hypothetical protein
MGKARKRKQLNRDNRTAQMTSILENVSDLGEYLYWTTNKHTAEDRGIQIAHNHFNRGDFKSAFDAYRRVDWTKKPEEFHNMLSSLATCHHMMDPNRDMDSTFENIISRAEMALNFSCEDDLMEYTYGMLKGIGHELLCKYPKDALPFFDVATEFPDLVHIQSCALHIAQCFYLLEDRDTARRIIDQQCEISNRNVRATYEGLKSASHTLGPFSGNGTAEIIRRSIYSLFGSGKRTDVQWFHDHMKKVIHLTNELDLATIPAEWEFDRERIQTADLNHNLAHHDSLCTLFVTNNYQPQSRRRTSHTVIHIDEHVYKIGTPMDVLEEQLHMYYQVALNGSLPDKRIYLRPEGLFDFDQIPTNLSINLPRRLAQFVVMPPDLQEKLKCTGSLTAYERISGTPLDIILTSKDTLTKDISLSKTTEVLATLHALSPKHILEGTPFYTPPTACEYARRLKKITQKKYGFSCDDNKKILRASDIISRPMQNPLVTVAVKDANPGNWIIAFKEDSPQVVESVTPLDFETTFVTAPQWDLVKLLDYFPQSTQKSHKTLSNYITTYNQVAREVNESVPFVMQRDIIENHPSFHSSYELHVIDQSIKLFHREQYQEMSYVDMRMDWMQRGMDAIDWLNDHEEYTADDTAKLSTLKGIFEKYRNKTARLF